MAFDDEDPNEIQKLQINETIRFIKEQEKIIRKYDKSLESMYKTMAGYHPPDEDLKPFFDRFLTIGALHKSLVADIKLYNAKNYTDYGNLDKEESF